MVVESEVVLSVPSEMNVTAPNLKSVFKTPSQFNAYHIQIIFPLIISYRDTYHISQCASMKNGLDCHTTQQMDPT